MTKTDLIAVLEDLDIPDDALVVVLGPPNGPFAIRSVVTEGDVVVIRTRTSA